jgi:cobalamin-dependent methionine synthase I
VLLVGERINSSREKIAQAIKEKNSSVIQQEAQRQAEAGADYIDVNAGTFLDEEIRYLPWLVETIQEAVDRPLCIDTSNAEALDAALKICRKKALVNSITAEKGRYDAFLPLVKKYACSLTALCIDNSGIPPTIEGRLKVASQIISSLLAEKIAPQDIYIDPLVQPVSVDFKSVIIALETIKQIKSQHPEIRTIIGLSNVSFGLPLRQQLNRTFAVLVTQAGVDAAILDPCDTRLMAHIVATETLLGQDELCVNYIKAYRSGKLGKD